MGDADAVLMWHNSQYKENMTASESIIQIHQFEMRAHQLNDPFIC